MNKFFIVLTIVFFWLSPSFAQSPKLFLEKTVIDLGRVKEGKIYDGSFRVENQGDSDLVLKSAQASCSCVQIKDEKEYTLKPGQEQEIKFSFNSTGYNGQVTQFIYLNTNDLENKIASIQIKAEVLAEKNSMLERFKSFSPGVIIGAGLVDGINPCAFTVLVFFISFMTFVGYSKRQTIITGSSFIFAVFLTYLLLGFGLFSFIHQLGIFRTLSRVIYIATGLLAIILGIYSWYDWRIYRRTKNPEDIKLKLPDAVKKKIQGLIRQKTDIRTPEGKERTRGLKLIATAFSCGFLVSLLESVCTGQLYVPTIVYVLKTQGLHLKAFFYLLVYNLMFILPLIVIFILGVVGVGSQKFSGFAHRHLGMVKLITAFVFFCLGVALLLIK
ncbi:MAG: DUF1573 domain-containing protein [Candidatus Omnitrophota bacterium]